MTGVQTCALPIYSGDTDKWKAEPKRQELVSSDVAEDLELVEDSEIPF